MLPQCRRGRPRRQLISVILFAITGFICILVLRPSTSFQSVQLLSNSDRNTDPTNNTKRRQNDLLYSLEIIPPEHGPAVGGIPDAFKDVRVAHNRFHYQSHKNDQIPKPKVESTRSLVKKTSDFDRLPTTNASGLETEQSAESQNEGLKTDKKLNAVDDKQRLASSSKQAAAELKNPLANYSLLHPRDSTPRRYAKDPNAYERYRRYLTEKEPPLPEQEVAVIILTNHRSGSSFFGELFNQHPDAFYLFEPLFPLSNSSECNLHRELKIEILKDYVRCKLPNWSEIYRVIPPTEQIRKNGNMKLCILKGICFRMNTKELCEDRHCPRTNDSSIKNCVFDCGSINRGSAENVCRRKKMVVLKLIRLCDIMDLESILKATPNIKVLHLLRDPRGIANSRRSINKRLYLKKSLFATCNRQSHNLLTAVKEPPEWLKGKYKVVRYEDTAVFPYETAQSVYDFVGLSFPDAMKKWIAMNTDAEIPTAKTSIVNGASLVENGQNNLSHRAKQFDPYGTRRNSTAIVQKWVKYLPYSTVLQVESVCSKIMKLAGYIKVGILKQYRGNNRKFFTDNITILNEWEHS